MCAYLFVYIQLSEDLRGVKEVGVVQYSMTRLASPHNNQNYHHANHDAWDLWQCNILICGKNVLLRVESQERQVENQCHPVTIDNEEDGHKAMNSGLWDDVGVETVAEIDRIDVITVHSKR